ncbi:MAG: sirohydrochlorin chelatase [Cyanobacteria bacterium SBLK]|nr:sirohydrochlorin chelatase [Cyanobacteria bacterium SBLK]
MLETSLTFPSLPLQRPLLAIGHGTRNEAGRQTFIDFAKAYEAIDPSRPVIPCFLELTTPSIQDGVDYCIERGYSELSAVPILLFAARHNKFDVTNELDRARSRHPQLKFHYGRHFGIAPEILDLWKERLQMCDRLEKNPRQLERSQTVLLFVGRGSSDPDANGDVFKMARMLWEGSGYKTVETCFIGITHPRLEEGFDRARLYNPQRIIVLPYFLFTGVLMEKIFQISAQQQERYPDIEVVCLPEMGIQPHLLQLLRERELETQLGQVQMNCEMCKFRLAALDGAENGHHHHHHHHDRNHDSAPVDPYADVEQYHGKIWQVP